MEVKKAIKKVLALGAGATMVGATILSATAASLDDYPAPFVSGGEFDAMIVVGDAAAPADIIGAVDIAMSLQYSMTTTKTVSTGGSATTVVVEGDAKKIEQNTDALEFGQLLDSITSSVTGSDMSALAGGSITNEKGTYSYTEQITMPKAIVTYAIDPDDSDNIPAPFLKFNSSVDAYRYKLSFSPALKSDVDADGATNALNDIKGKTITMLGKKYSILKAEWAGQNQTKLTLMGGAVTTIMEEGETKTLSIEDNDYDVTVDYIGGTTDKVKFTVNGEVTDSLQVSETFKLKDGTELGIKDIMQNEAGEAVGGDKVEFDLGADKIVLQDTATRTDASGGTITVGSTDMANVMLDIKASSDTAMGTTDGIIQISSIEIWYQPSQDLYIPKDGKLSTVADTAEFEEGNVFLDGFDIEFKGLQVPATEEISLRGSNNDNYRLKFKNKAGQEYNDPIVCFNTSTTPDGNTNIHLGQLSGSTYRKLHMVEGVATSEKDFLLVSKSKYTHILQYTNINQGTTSDGQGTITFKDAADGSVYSVSYTSLTGDLVLDGNTYVVNASSDTANSAIWVDLDGSGTIGSNVALDGGYSIWTEKEANINLTEQNNGNVTVTIWSETQEDKSTRDSVAVSFVETGTDVLDLAGKSVATVTQDTHNWGAAVGLLTEGDGYISRVYTKYGMLVEYDARSSTADNQDILTVTYPDEQVSAAVYVTSGAITTTDTAGSEAGTIEVKDIVRVDVGSAVLASKVVDSIEDSNLIVVGGPCANSVAAALSGNPANCAAGYETGKAKLKLFSHANGNVALLIAGASADDTTRAAKVIAKYDSYELTGDEMEVITTSDADISVSAVEAMAEVVEEAAEEPAAEEPAAEEPAAEEPAAEEPEA